MNTQITPDSARRIAQMLAEADRLRRAGRYSDAESICRQILKISPRTSGVLNFLALLVKQRGDFVEAEALFRRAIEASPNEAALHNNLANLQLAMGNISGAEESLLRAIKLQEVYPEAYYNLGIVRRQGGAHAEALKAFRGAVEQNNRHVAARTQIGLLLSEEGRNVEALMALDSAIAIDPNAFEAHYYRGSVLSALDRFDEAIAAFNVALSIRPGSHIVFHALGNTLARARREDEAIEQYKKALDAAPEFLEAHRDYNTLVWEMGRHDENLKSYARARERVGDTPDLLLAEANQRIRLEQGEVAEALLRRAHDAAPERTDITNALARALTLQKKYDEGIQILDRLTKVEPNATYNFVDAAIALLQMGEPKEAARYLEDAHRRSPYDQLVLAHLALAWRSLGDSRLDRLVDHEKLVGIYDLAPPPGFDDAESFNRALSEDLHVLHTRRVEPFNQTLRGGTQTPGYLFERPTRAIEGVRERIREAVADYVGKLGDDPQHPLFARKDSAFDFATAWSCKLNSSGFHTNHVHPKGWISSAYYAALPDVISEGSGEQGWLKFGESNIGLGKDDRPGRTIKPAIGRLVLFPSYFWHGTVPFTAQEPRLTIAFDVVPGTVDDRIKLGVY